MAAFKSLLADDIKNPPVPISAMILLFKSIITTLISLFLCYTLQAAENSENESDLLDFDDTLLEEELGYPDWFEITLGDLRDNIKSAAANNKQGIIIYFGQKRCAYCAQFLNNNLETEDINNYLQKNFDVIPVDIWGIDDIIDTDGTTYTERELSIHYKTNFTPSLIFYNNKGKAVFRLRGYYPPYKFGAALKYVAEGFYEKETFREYLERAEPNIFFMLGGLNERDFFSDPPYNLKNLNNNTDRALAVFFEQGDCHACDLLHTGPLNKETTLKEIAKMNAVQLDMWSDTPLIKPDGNKTTAREWAKELDLFYSPSLIFFDSSGKEIIRLESVVKFYRLWGVLDYINQKGYLNEPDYQSWRLKQRDTK